MELLVAYTNPSLRNKIKNQVMASSQGGRPGQWSARKAQLVAQKYKKAGGGYSGAKTAAQSNLTKWTKEKWKTSDGKEAIRKDKTTRYLPERAWANLSAAEKAATNKKKIEASKRGKQFVANTKTAQRASRQARS
jgi:hypothetical protein